MLLILYYVNHRCHPKEIELCGWFQDMQAFERLKKNQAFSGWNVTRYKLLKGAQ